MMRSVFRFTSGLAVGFTSSFVALILLSLVFASLTLPHPLLAELCDISAPCWHGIVPDQTSYNEAVQQLEAWGYERIVSAYGRATTFHNPAATDWCYVTLGVFEGRLTSIALQQCADRPDPLRVGDVAGEPLSVFYTGEVNYDYARVTLSADGLSPLARLNTITLTIDGGTVYSPCQVRWIGFAFVWAYQRQARVQC